MHRAHRYILGSLVLMAGFAVPAAVNAAGSKDYGRQEGDHRDDKDHNRVYDRDHKDYHNWDDN